MKKKILLIGMILFLGACGRLADFDDGDDGNNGAGKGRPEAVVETDITVTIIECQDTTTDYVFEYRVVVYPNGDKSVYCRMGGKEFEMEIASSHRWADEAVCILDYYQNDYYRFKIDGSVEFVGNTDESFVMETCDEETFEDEEWAHGNY